MKGFGLLGIVIVLAVIATLGIGGGLYYSEKKKQQSLLKTGNEALKKASELKAQIEGKTATEIDTSDWKTYRNEKYGFEIKYPSEWIDAGPSRLEPNKNYADLIALGFPTNTQLSIGIIDQSIDEAPKFVFLIRDAGMALESAEDVFVPAYAESFPAKRLVIKNEYVGDRFVDVLIPRGNKTLELWVLEQRAATLDQILSTLKFIE